MTDGNQDGPGKAPDGPQDGQTAPVGQSDTPSPVDHGKSASGDSGNGPGNDPGKTDLFPREYVEELRKESKGYRTRSQQMAQKLVHSIAAQNGRLADPTDLPFGDDLLGEDGFPDPEKIEQAISDLIEKKPHLAAIRPKGDIGQGQREETTSGSWLDTARSRI